MTITELFRASLPPYQTSIRLQSDVFSLQLIDNVIQSCINRLVASTAADDNPDLNVAAFQRIKELWTKQVKEEIGLVQAQPKLVMSDVRLSTPFPALKRLKGLEGFPIPVTKKGKDSKSWSVRKQFILKDEKGGDSHEEEHTPAPLVSRKKVTSLRAEQPLVTHDVIHGSQVEFSYDKYNQDHSEGLIIRGKSDRARVIQINRRRNGRNQIVETFIKLRFPLGAQLVLPWPNAYCEVVKVDAEVGGGGEVEFEREKEDVVMVEAAESQSLLSDVNQLLDGFSMLDDDEEEEEGGFMFSYSSLIDSPSTEKKSLQDKDKATSSTSARDEYDKNKKSDKEEEKREDTICLLLTGERISKPHFEEVEEYFQRLKQHRPKFFISHGSDDVKPNNGGEIILHPDDDPSIVNAASTAVMVGRAQRVSRDNYIPSS